MRIHYLLTASQVAERLKGVKFLSVDEISFHADGSIAELVLKDPDRDRGVLQINCTSYITVTCSKKPDAFPQPRPSDVMEQPAAPEEVKTPPEPEQTEEAAETATTKVDDGLSHAPAPPPAVPEDQKCDPA